MKIMTIQVYLVFFPQSKLKKNSQFLRIKYSYQPAGKKHNKARVIVYAKDDLKIKQIELDSSTDHLQCINLDIGYGQAKKHFFSFYYREWTSCVTGSKDNQKEDLSSFWIAREIT